MFARFFTALMVSIFLFNSVIAQSLNPAKLLIYYGYPSQINGVSSNQAAADTLGQYDYVVLGDGLEKASHSDHLNTVEIISLVHSQYSTKIFGYIDAGVSTQNLSLAEIGTRVKEWKATGADGIFFDDFGYDYQTDRARQNAVVDSAHASNLPVCANAWNPDDAFGTQVDPVYNPTGAQSHLGASDFYLSESYQIENGAYQDATTWQNKADKLDAYQKNIGFGIWSVTTNNSGNAFDQQKFNYAWYSALLYGHVATGWGEYQFSSFTSQAPYRQPPAVNSGTSFLSEVTHTNPVHYRHTNTGKVWINTDFHTYGFDENSNSTVTIDGDFSDWNGLSPYITDSAGDYSDSNLDLLRGYFTFDNAYLFLRTQVAGVYGGTAGAGDGYHIYLDTDLNSTTGLNYGWWSMGADYLVEQVSGGGAFLYKYAGTGSDWSWNFVATLNEAHSAGNSELQIALTDLGLSTGASIYLQWASVFSWNDVDLMQDNPGSGRSPAILDSPSASGKPAQVPANIELYQNYPNPFNSSTMISYYLPQAAFVRLEVFDVNGRKLQTLVNQHQLPGKYKQVLNLKNFSSGIYFYRLMVNSWTLTKKMFLLK